MRDKITEFENPSMPVCIFDLDRNALFTHAIFHTIFVTVVEVFPIQTARCRH